jgi:hypothetical protein
MTIATSLPDEAVVSIPRVDDDERPTLSLRLLHETGEIAHRSSEAIEFGDDKSARVAASERLKCFDHGSGDGLTKRVRE